MGSASPCRHDSMNRVARDRPRFGVDTVKSEDHDLLTGESEVHGIHYRANNHRPAFYGHSAALLREATGRRNAH
jgi:hypothetical protein